MNGLRIIFLIGVFLLAFVSCGQCVSVVVTGSITLVEPSECYIESIDRSSGIWVQAVTTGLAVGDIVTATGTLGIAGGERVIQGATLTPTGGRSAISPLAMRNIWLGGHYSAGTASLLDYLPYRTLIDGTGWHWQAAAGASNTGLLVTTWGKVTAVCYSPATGAHFFHLDDGSGVVGDYGDPGVIVYSDADVSEGDFVNVTGISSIEVALDDATKLVRVIRPRSTSDVSCVKEANTDSICPFSDEFDSPTLDSRWGFVGKASYISLASNPGWLALSTTYDGYTSPYLVQTATGNWDMEMKFRPQFDSAPTVFCTFCVTMRGYPQSTTGTDLALFGRPGWPLSTRLLGQAAGTLEGGTYWLRVRMRRPLVYASVSSDGINYSTEYSATTTLAYITFWASTSSYGTRWTPILDYVRFTRVD